MLLLPNAPWRRARIGAATARTTTSGLPVRFAR